MTRLKWPAVLDHAAGIVRSYDTRVTLRQLFYRLVSDQTLPNTQTTYRSLSRATAEARRRDGFPDLLDRGSHVYQPLSWIDPADLLTEQPRRFALDHTFGQEYQIWLAIEKAGLVEQVSGWFSDRHFPVVPLGGYVSQSFADDVRRRVEYDERPAVLLYAGDWDPSGEDIERDWIERTHCWAKSQRIALTEDQAISYGLPENFGKPEDPRADAFIEKYGRLAQIEVDALDPETLHRLYEEAAAEFWDRYAFDQVLAEERWERDRLAAFVSGWTQ